MVFTKLQHDSLQGCLLGDGHLALGKNSKNANFSYLSSSRQHVEFIYDIFSCFCGSGIKRRETYDSRTNKTYTSYSFRTASLAIFTEQHTRWYRNKTKIVPPNLEISKDVLLTWYLGDGELESNYGYVKLHTNAFSEAEVWTLCKKLSFASDYFRKGKASKQLIIRIPRRQVSSFLKVIGNCPFQDYAHKWKEVPYNNKNIEANGVRNHSKKYPKVIEDWLSGAYSIYKLSKKYDVDIYAIKNNFRVNGIDYLPLDTRKEIKSGSGTLVRKYIKS